jgi:hypothetical protein
MMVVFSSPFSLAVTAPESYMHCERKAMSACKVWWCVVC